MTTPDANVAPPVRRITVEDIDRALDFVVALVVLLKGDPVLLEGDGLAFPLPIIAQKSREPRGLYWAPEAYRPNQDVDLQDQELQHVGRVLNALSEGDFLIPVVESPWEDWDGVEPAEAGSIVSCPDCQTDGIGTPASAAAKLYAYARAVVVGARLLASKMRDRLSVLLQSARTYP